MSADHQALICVFVICIMSAGCSSRGEALRVGDEGLGSHWELEYWEGPSAILVEPPTSGSEDGSTQGFDAYTVEAFGLRLGGWGAWMPWSWFREHRIFVYSVDLEGPTASGGTYYVSDVPLSGIFSRPELATRDRGSDSGLMPRHGVDWDAYRAARDAAIGGVNVAADRRMVLRSISPSEPERPGSPARH